MPWRSPRSVKSPPTVIHLRDEDLEKVQEVIDNTYSIIPIDAKREDASVFNSLQLHLFFDINLGGLKG